MANTDPTGYLSIPPDLIRGLAWKQPVRVASTANLTLSGAQTIDGVACVAGNRVLAKDQTAGAGNGIYVVASGAWVRSYDFDQDLTTAVPAEEAMGAVVKVLLGTANAGTYWQCTNSTTPTLGTTALTFTQFGAPSTGTVTSVALTVPAEFSVAGSPITTSGTLAVTKATQTANLVYAGPSTGSAAAPTFRALVSADIPAGVGTHYEPLTSGASSAPELVFTADGRCVMVPVAD